MSPKSSTLSGSMSSLRFAAASSSVASRISGSWVLSAALLEVASALSLPTSLDETRRLFNSGNVGSSCSSRTPALLVVDVDSFLSRVYLGDTLESCVATHGRLFAGVVVCPAGFVSLPVL